VAEQNIAEEEVKKFNCYDYPAMTKTLVGFLAVGGWLVGGCGT
jgi:hypothetical protein